MTCGIVDADRELTVGVGFADSILPRVLNAACSISAQSPLGRAL